jgi:hypothetical protein
VLRAQEEFVFLGPPPRAGIELTVQERLETVYEKTGRRGGRMRFFVIVEEFRDGTGEVVAESRMTLVETAKVPD